MQNSYIYKFVLMQETLNINPALYITFQIVKKAIKALQYF